MIHIENLFYEYPGKRALNNINVDIKRGSITALVGPNGAGKSTLLRCISGLEEPFSGKVFVDGIDVAENPRIVHTKLGYLSDFFGLYSDLTVKQSLIFIAKLHQIPEEKIIGQIAWVENILELTAYMDNRTNTLSRGWRQRVGIAQAIIHNPSLLLLDEPASGLDPEARILLSSLLINLQKHGMTLVVSSHILAELEDYCTEMLILRDGNVVTQRSSTAESKEYLIEIKFIDFASQYLDRLKDRTNVSQVSLYENIISFYFSGDEKESADILKELILSGAIISSFAANRQKMQDIYMSLSNERTNK